MSLSKILDKYAVESFSKRDKGDKFERIIAAYFYTDPKYSNLIDRTWLWSDFPYKSEFGGNDRGIDLVIKTKNGEFWAIQCKCVKDDAYVDKGAIDSFLSTSAKFFETEKGDVYKFANRVWVSTSNNWSSTATETLINQDPPVTRINLTDLQEAPVDWGKLEQDVHGVSARNPAWDPRPHQLKAIESTIDYKY